MKFRVPYFHKYRQDALASNSIHLYFDMGWFGVLTGSTLSFLAIYAARIGASSFQIGMINGVQALVNLCIALPVGLWLARRPVDKSFFASAILQRMFYAVLIFLPILFTKSGEMTVILVTTFVMSIPGTAVSIGFNALFADSVPAENRGRVAGIRNAVLSITTILTTLICGQILTLVVFPLNYQIVFGIGFFGAALSTLHLGFIKPAFREKHAEEQFQTVPGPTGYVERIFSVLMFCRGILVPKSDYCLDFILFSILGIAIFPIYQVNILHLTDSVISIGNGIFYVLMFVFSMRLEGMTFKYGYKNILGAGIVLLAMYPAILSMSHEPLLFYVACIMGGIAWGLAGGAIYNYILESAPPGGRAGFLAWYNLVFNAGILLGSLGGPLLGNLTNFHIALWIVAAGRLAMGLALLYWG